MMIKSNHQKTHAINLKYYFIKLCDFLFVEGGFGMVGIQK